MTVLNKKAIATDSAPAAIGPYSQGIVAGGLVFTSGQIPVDPATGNMVLGGIQQQAHRCLKNVLAVLGSAGCTAADVVKTTVFITDMADFPAVNAVYEEYFPQPFPARSCVEVSKLPKGVNVEIEAIALKNSK